MNRIVEQAHNRRHAFLTLFLWTVAAISVSSPAASQVEVVPASPAVFRESIHVRLVNIDVFVTDRDGNPVDDLGLEDFELFVNGEPVSISHFALVGTIQGAPQGEGAVDPSAGNLGSVQTLTRGAAEEASLPHLVIAFDSRHLTHVAKHRMMKGLHQYIGHTSIPHSHVMIVDLGHGRSDGFDVVVPFGSTREDLEDGLDRIRKMAPGGRGVAIEYQNLIERLTQTHMEFRRRDVFRPGDPEPNENPIQACRAVKTQWQAEIQSFSNQTALRVDDTVRLLTGLMRGISGAPGHKAFLYIGGGLELVPGEDIYAYANKICPGTFNLLEGQGNARNTVMRQLTEAANAYRISFNAFEASTFRLSMISSSEYSSPLYNPGPTVERIRTTNLQNSLVMLANETGGKAFLNTNGFFPDSEVLEKALCSYYSLGYSPPHPGGGEAHNLKVRLKREDGLRLRYRRSYSELSEAELLEDKLMSMLAFGWSHNPLQVRVAHGAIKPAAGGKDTFLVPLSVTLPVTRLVCVPEEVNDSSCHVRLVMRVSDEKERMSRQIEKLYDIHLTEGSSSEDAVKLQMISKMRRGNHRVAVGVMDAVGLTASYVTCPVSVGIP